MDLKFLAYQIENQEMIKKQAAQKISEKIVGKELFLKIVLDLLSDNGYYVIDQNQK